MTSSNRNIFRVTGHLRGEFPAQRPVTRSFDVLFDLRLNKRLSKQSWGWLLETLSHPLWRHRNVWTHKNVRNGPQSYTARNLVCSHVAINWTFHWRHNGHDGVPNHQPHDCLLKRLFRSRSKKTSKLRVTCLCAGNWPGTGEFTAQMTSYAENVSIWWCHRVKDYDFCIFDLYVL